ncbi:MAG TPA: hypothetical protein VMM12_05470 [Longimicrobiales bacterium]|nr:hypothetical protein [Longimicrobiales bacterium]
MIGFVSGMAALLTLWIGGSVLLAIAADWIDVIGLGLLLLIAVGILVRNAWGRWQWKRRQRVEAGSTTAGPEVLSEEEPRR